MAKTTVDSAGSLLEAAYRDLDLANGALLPAAKSPGRSNGAVASAWLEKGEWLSLAHEIGAERVFFVRDNPVVVFASAATAGPEAWQKFFRDAWCMARPMVLFLATPGELAVYDLTKGPSRTGESQARSDRLIDVAHSTTDVQRALSKFRRDRIESGRLFEEYHFGDCRADAALVADIQTVRRRLVESGLDRHYANALIGRSLFVRYLEDRGVLDTVYFRKVANGTKSWTAILDSTPQKDSLGNRMPLFPELLQNKRFAYALFDQLAVDFNGDVFPVEADERREVEQPALDLLKDLLTGQAEPSLFFFAYRFNIVPIELISNIYEEFLRSKDGGKPTEGSYYTRSSLVEFLLNQTLTDELLNTKPRIVDPACGSGIFLVECFRRLVRHLVKQLGRLPSAEDLHGILLNQIAGVDINPQAVRVAAFSLYLAMLHYLDPPTIRNNKLPYLVYLENGVRNPKRKYFDILVAGNAFEIEKSVIDEHVQSRFGSACADLVVGNPPWGTPAGDDVLAKESREGAGRWCKAHEKALGDKELSQAFIHRAMDLLRENGQAALLVSTGVFFKRHKKSQAFRQQWLEAAILQQVVNFASVRHFFFQRPKRSKGRRTSAQKKDGAISPFASVRFRKGSPGVNHRFQYWSAKRTAIIESAEAVVLSRTDVHWVSQQELLQDERLWKVYWWGNHRDAAFVRELAGHANLKGFVKTSGGSVRRGYQPQPPLHPAKWLSAYAELPTRALTSFGPIPSAAFVKVPPQVFRRGVQSSYEGPRILLKRGISEKGSKKGVIIARFETERFCFRDSIYSIRLPEVDRDGLKLLLGVLWSSLSRYFFFVTSGRWGMWHNDLQKDTLARLPICPTNNRKRSSRVVELVRRIEALPSPEMKRGGTQLQKRSPGGAVQLNLPLDKFTSVMNSQEQRSDDLITLQAQLDSAIFDLYELSDEQRDLVLEMCDLGLDYMYHGRNSKSVAPITIAVGNRRFGRRGDLTPSSGIPKELQDYIRTFLDLWEPRLKRYKGWLRWRLALSDRDASILAIMFSTESADDMQPVPTNDDQAAWTWIVNDLAESCGQQAWAKEIYIDGMLRLVTSHEIAIVKRNERRLWTRTAAREDVEATMADLLIRAGKQASQESK